MWGLTLLGTVQWQLAFRCGASRYWVLYNGSWPLGVGLHAIGWQLAFRCGASRYWVLYNGSWPLGVGPHAIGYCTIIPASWRHCRLAPSNAHSYLIHPKYASQYVHMHVQTHTQVHACIHTCIQSTQCMNHTTGMKTSNEHTYTHMRTHKCTHKDETIKAMYKRKHHMCSSHVLWKFLFLMYSSLVPRPTSQLRMDYITTTRVYRFLA